MVYLAIWFIGLVLALKAALRIWNLMLLEEKG